jgi:hypothetical protein
LSNLTVGVSSSPATRLAALLPYLDGRSRETPGLRERQDAGVDVDFARLESQRTLILVLSLFAVTPDPTGVERLRLKARGIDDVYQVVRGCPARIDGVRLGIEPHTLT